MRSVLWASAAVALVCGGLVAGQQAEDDDLLRAMRAELQRVKTLTAGEAGAPYYVEYALDDLESFTVSASMGGTLVAQRSRNRVPRVEVRVGDYAFDNTNFAGGAGRGGLGALPIEADATAIRRGFWLATDALYKNAVEALTRKKTALMNVTQQQGTTLKDFARAEPVTKILPLRRMEFKDEPWRQAAAALSGIFKEYPKVVSSLVNIQANYSNSYFLNTEGSAYRFADDLITFRVNASGQAPDGMPVSEGATLLARTPGGWASEAEMRRVTTEVARNVTALLDAPMGETYAGPVILEGVASAQLLAQLLSPNLTVARRTAGGGGGGRGGGPAQGTTGEWEGRVGARVLPEWMDVVDDPTLESFKGHELLGFYPVDMEGVVPRPITLVERGLLKNYLLTRQPVTGYEGSNGHARLPGANGAKQAVYSNLFVRANEKVSAADLKRRMLDMVRQRGKAYGLIVRKIDFPQTGSSAGITRRPGASAVAPPLLVYKVFPDGREELVRGLSFASINVRGLRDITAASDEEHIFDYIASSGNYIVGHSVIAPSILFEDMEFDRREADWPKPPFVPPPGR